MTKRKMREGKMTYTGWRKRRTKIMKKDKFTYFPKKIVV